MTKVDLVEKLHQQLGFSKKEASANVEVLLDLIKTTLANGDRIKISGFGTFDVRQKHDRRGRNPQTGEAMTIEARKVLTFKSSNILRQALNG